MTQGIHQWACQLLLLAGIRSAIGNSAPWFWGTEVKAYVTELAQDDDMLLKQQHRPVAELQIASEINCGKTRLRGEVVIATIAGTEDSNIGYQSKSTEKM